MKGRPRIRTLMAAAALAVGALSGGATGIPTASAGHVSGPYFDLGTLPVPDYTGKQIFDGLKQFVADFPLRHTGTPNEIRSGLALHQEMQGLGYTVSTRTLGAGVDNEQGVGAGLKAIVATKLGTTKPDEWLMFIGHYDTFPQTVDGAYDNGSGTNFIRFMAKEFANVPTNRSLVFVWYNGEEEGILASERHATELQASGQPVAAVLGFDMVGIAWPVAAPTSTDCLCMWYGADDKPRFDPLLRYVNYTFLGFPGGSGSAGAKKVRLVGANDRNSDESSFEDRGFHTLRWAGKRTAASYTGYHNPTDTIATIISQSGGETYYEDGVFNTLKSAYYTTLALDNHAPVASFTAAKAGRTVTVDASASTDQDGALSSFQWSFGDGATAQGATAQHTYAAAGTYTVTLSVADNLWPNVTRSTTLNVTVS